MKDQLVSYETAKLAKEKGFDWKVRYSFGHRINPHIAYPKEDFGVPSDFNSPNIGRNWKHLFSAPTQSLLQKWLREEHNIDVTIALVDAGYGFYIHQYKDYTNEGENYGVSGYTFEEALEKGLQEALKLI